MKEHTEGLRLNQAIAKTGLCSRRDADRLIASGRVAINGQVAQDFSLQVRPGVDSLTVDGKELEIQDYVYIAMYKPAGIVTSCADEKNRTTVVDLLPAKLRHLRPVGRLDMNSEGLLLLTNDGQLTQKVAHPVHHVVKRYQVTVKGGMSDDDLLQMSKGIKLSEGLTLPAEVQLLSRSGGQTVFDLSIREGRNRQIRRMCAELGYSVSRLVRLSIGGLQLGQMTPGAWRYLTSAEVRHLERS